MAPSTSGLGGGCNPYGFRGPDLIETIRLEKVVGNRYLGPAGSSGVSFPHPYVDINRGVAVRQSREGRIKVWAEPAWNRPNTADSSMRVYDEEQHKFLLSEGGGPADEEGSQMPSPGAGSPVKSTQSPLGSHAASQVSRTPSRAPSRAPSHTPSIRPQTAPTAGSHKRELARLQFEQRQQAIQQKLKVRQKQQAAEAERDFTNAWDTIMKTEAGLVADVTEMLDLREKDEERKHRVHHRDWHEKVFDRIQHDIDRQIAHRVATRDLGDRWRAAQDDYLRAEKKKDAGIFRDIIIPDEYDPMICRNQDIKYRVKVDDPLKLELSRAAAEKRMLPGSTADEELVSERLPPTMWDKLEATPYGRFSKMMAAGSGPINPQKEAQQKSAIPFDHFGFDRTRAIIDREFPNPKRTFANRR